MYSFTFHGIISEGVPDDIYHSFVFLTWEALVCGKREWMIWVGEDGIYKDVRNKYILCLLWFLQPDKFSQAVCKAGITNLNHGLISKVNIFILVLQIEELSQHMVNVFVKVT